jgi:hypothetical protein
MILIVVVAMGIVSVVFFINGLMVKRVDEVEVVRPEPEILVIPDLPVATPTTVNNSVETFLQSDPNVGEGFYQALILTYILLMYRKDRA